MCLFLPHGIDGIFNKVISIDKNNEYSLNGSEAVFFGYLFIIIASIFGILYYLSFYKYVKIAIEKYLGIKLLYIYWFLYIVIISRIVVDISDYQLFNLILILINFPLTIYHHVVVSKEELKMKK